MTVKARCDCGAVEVVIPRAPEKLTVCPCDFCRRVGVRWAYFPEVDVTITGETDAYRRGAKRLAFHRCATCGCLTHWQAETVDWENSGVNMLNFDPEVTDGLPEVPSNMKRG